MKLITCIDDEEYSHLLESQFGAEGAELQIIECASLDEVLPFLQGSSLEDQLVIIDAFSGAMELVQKFPDRSIILTSPKYDRALESRAYEIGAVGYFPRIQDADVVAYVIEQLRQISFGSTKVH
jgi:hypothetical protein